VTPPCWVCGAPTSAAAELAPLPYVRCGACELVFRPGEIHGHYEQGAYAESHGELYATADELEARRHDARVRLDWIGRRAGVGARVLDVGAAGGAFVAEAAARGYRASGIEPTPEFARHAREVLGVDVAEGTLESIQLSRYEAITLWHVLEHIPEPLEQLRRVRAALEPGGILALEVPNYGGVSALRMGKAWPSLEPDVHVNQFSPRSLRELLVRAGFGRGRIETTTIAPYLSRGARLGPRYLAMRAKAAVALRDPRGVHPFGHELLRAISVA
jgi:SAM-dependent methyltransferase